MARTTSEQLLFKGEDFSQTDLRTSVGFQLKSNRQYALFLKEKVQQAMNITVENPEDRAPRTGQVLIDICAEVRGLLTDDEIDSMFTRNRMMSRLVDL